MVRIGQLVRSRSCNLSIAGFTTQMGASGAADFKPDESCFSET